jgi:hypothetical protein
VKLLQLILSQRLENIVQGRAARRNRLQLSEQRDVLLAIHVIARA